MYIISFEIAAFILSLVCLAYLLTVKRRQYMVRGGLFTKLQNQHFVFLLLLAGNMISAAASVGGVHLQSIASAKTAGLQYFLHAVYFFFHSMVSGCFALYIMNVTGTTIGRSRRFFRLFVLPLALTELLVLTNRYTSLAFYMDEQYIYHRGPLMPVLYAVAALYILLGVVFFYRYKQAVSRADGIAIGVVICTATLGVVLQALRADLLVELFAEALAFLMLMVLLEERSGHIDPITGALNRLAFADINRRYMQTGQRYGILLIKLTNLELYSRLFGGRRMESLLMSIANWLGTVVSVQDLFCCGQEEFAVLVLSPDPRDAENTARKVLERFERDWRVDAMTLRLEAAVTIVRVPEEIASLEQLEELLASTYRRGGGSRLLRYDEMADYRRARATEAALRRAVAEGSLRVWYQPIWSAEEKRSVAAEALLRIDAEDFRGVSPEVYIPIAEQCGLIREIGSFVFEDVCRFLSQHAAETEALRCIELNLSVYQFLYDDVAARFEEIRARYGIPAARLNLEITESASDRTAPGMRETVERLRSLGYTFSLDDFGSGYANLSRLIQREYMNVKIDKSLLWDSDRSGDTRLLLDNVTRLLRALGYSIIQEGVETPAQLERATASGCNLIQGYYFSRPLPEDDFLRYLEAERRT